MKSKGGDYMKKGILLNLRLTLALLLLVGGLFTTVVVTQAGRVEAATSANITVAGTPAYVAMNLTPITWTVNGITGDSAMRSSATYYANPLGDQANPGVTINDTSCQFTLGNPGSVNMTTTIDWHHFSGVGISMSNGETGAAGATTFGGKTYFSGPTYAVGTLLANAVVAKTTGSDVAYDDLGPSYTVKFGIIIAVQTDAWSSATSMTSQIKVSVVEHS